MKIVICRDYYREHPPIRYIINTDSDEIASDNVIKRDWIKEILDVVDNIVWDKETVIKYWKTYSDNIDESKITSEYLNSLPVR